ncbi:OmpA family protein [Moraxella osloensis]|uniref:OmpA family protein n=1 Tax=Faucicola osloensis TaxID=34062 RepID=UPI002002F486|nr:OmpA family protein [Moraxella osloensis]MCK6052697.1 OmpA family protein [Moraxella osloensis]
MNIIEHLTRTVTPVVLNNANDANRSSLLEKLYAILVARLADGNVSNSFANATIADNDNSFFDRVLPDTTHRTELVQQLSRHYSVPEQETASLVSRAAPLVLRELRSLAGTTPLNTFLSNNIASVASVIPAWAYAFIPAGILTMLNLSPVHAATTPTVQTTTRTEEHLVATPKRDEGGLMKMLLPIIGLLILGALAWALLKSCNKTEPVATPVVASTTASTTTTTTTTEVSAASATNSMAMPVASTTDMAVASMPMATTETVAATIISTTEPSVVFENGRLSFYFATGEAQVAGNAKEKANDILEAAKQGKKIGISGYTDSTGNAAANEKLAKERAQAVRLFLIANGVPQSQLELIKPQDTTGAEGKDQEGRRVDAYIIDDNAIPATGTTTVTTVASPAK